MRIANQCRDRALLLLQIAQECPQFKDQATHLAHELLGIATIRISLLARIERPEKDVRAN
jgi:hypothetical protein